MSSDAPASPGSARDFIVKVYDGVTVVRFSTEHLTAAHDLERITCELLALVSRGVRRLVLDFKHVRYISSATLSMLLKVNAALEDGQGRMVLSHPETLAELLRISKMNKIFPTAPGPREALEMLQAHGGGGGAEPLRINRAG